MDKWLPIMAAMQIALLIIFVCWLLTVLVIWGAIIVVGQW